MKLRLLLPLLSLFPLVASAGFLDDALNQVEKSAKQAYNKTVDTVTDAIDKTEDKPANEDKAAATAPKPETEPAPKPATPPSTESSQTATKSEKYIKLEDIPTGRRPATPAGMGLTRLRYDPDWIDDKLMLQLTEGVIYCQQNMIKPQGYQRGCVGERTDTAIKVVPVFDPSEVAGKNRKFVAQANPDRLKPVLIALARHLPPTFGNTLNWRGEYDFDRHVLKVSITGGAGGIEKAESYHLHRIPQNLAHMDVYKVPDNVSYGTMGGGYYQMKPYIPEGLASGIIALVFDRNLSEGAVPMSTSEAEHLFKNQSGNIIGGRAVVEFSVNRTQDNAAVATLEQVKILSVGEAVDPRKTTPIMTIPATAFPKYPEAQPVAKSPAPGKPKKALPPPAEPVVEKVAVDPYLRAHTGAAFGPDVVDLRLGMTFDEADSVLRKHKGVMKVIEGSPPRPFTRAVMYIFKPGDEFIGVLGLKTPQGERVATIDRTIYFDPEQSPSQTAITASVEKKYGPPSYKYEVKGNFNRNWYTDPEGRPTAKPNSETRACENVLGGSSNDTWLEGGNYFQWTMPWREKTYMGVRSSVEVGNRKSTENDKSSECGPTTEISYNDGSGMLTGASLRILLYDPAWIIADYTKLEASDAKQGVKGLDL